MTQAATLVETLKKQLKAHGRTYADVARALNLSEASVKRLFAGENFTLQRLESICALIDLDLAELIQSSRFAQQRTQELGEAQEQEIADDRLLLLVAVCVINGYGLADILAQYRLSETECIGKLARLDRLRLIELLPGNRIKLRIAPNFRWRPGGPIQRFFQEHVAGDFFRSRFDGESEKLLVLNGLLSPAGNAQWQRRMQRLVQEFNELCREEAGLPLEQRFGTTAVLAVRQWQYGMFEGFVRR
jgi:transcriptional regulator with XRE-family HTH domain